MTGTTRRFDVTFTIEPRDRESSLVDISATLERSWNTERHQWQVSAPDEPQYGVAYSDNAHGVVLQWLRLRLAIDGESEAE